MSTHHADYFDEKLNVHNITKEMLPFFHSCDAFFFRSIIIGKKLTPTKCTVFENEDLLYLFYGRPAYKASNLLSSRLSSMLPVSFILKSDCVDDIKRIAPFDTGAFHKGLYKDYIHPSMHMQNFFLTPNLSAIQKAISFFFDTNEAYFMGKPKKEVCCDPLDFEVESYFSLIKGIAQSAADDRKATFEIQLQHHLPLTCNSIEAVILPENFRSSEIVETFFVKELKVAVITYECFGIPSPLYYSKLLDLTKQYLIKKHAL